jgi:hypothetical protein
MKEETHICKKCGSDVEACSHQSPIPFANIFLGIALGLLLLAAARALFCPVPMSENGVSFLKWILSAALLILGGVQASRKVKIKF